MATMNIEEISRKRPVNRYNPNSYRIFCEDIGNGSVPEQLRYDEQQGRPPLPNYNTMIDNNHQMQAQRAASFANDNQRYPTNEPVANKQRVSREQEKRWWEWNTQSEDADPQWKHKKRSQSSTVSKGRENSTGEFQTTYQKEHGYLNDLKAQRHPIDPNMRNNAQQYSLNPDDYKANYAPNVNNAFVREKEATRSAAVQSRGQSVWDIMHPVYGSGQQQRVESSKSLLDGHQRRDPIGYFEESKYNPNIFVQPDQRQNPQMKYTPSWSNGYTAGEPMVNNQPYMANPLPINNQIPIAVNGNGIYNHD